MTTPQHLHILMVPLIIYYHRCGPLLRTGISIHVINPHYNVCLGLRLFYSAFIASWRSVSSVDYWRDTEAVQ